MITVGPATALHNSVVGDFYGIDDLIVKLQAAYEQEMAPYVGADNYSNIALYSNAGGHLADALRARAALRGSDGSLQALLRGDRRVDLTAENEFALLHPTVQAGIRGNPELAILSQFGLYDLPTTPEFSGWRLWTRNAANGDFLSVGAEGGVNALANVRWHPVFGLLIPTSAYMTIHDEPDWAGMIVMAALSAFGGAAISAVSSATSTGVQLVQAGYTIPEAASAAGISQDALFSALADVPAAAAGTYSGVAPALMDATMAQAVELVQAGFPYQEVAQMTGVNPTDLYSALADVPAAEVGALNVEAAQNAIDLVKNAPTQLPAELSGNQVQSFLPKLENLLPTAAGLKTAAGLAATFASLYKTVTKPNGATAYQLRQQPLTARQLQQQNSGVNVGFSSSLLPVVVMGIAALFSQ